MDWLRIPHREGALAALAAMLVFFLNLGGIALWDEDEPKNAVCAREMFERSDWLVPTFNGQLRTDKPILLYWLMLAAYHALGVTEFAARVWSAVLGTGTVLLTWDLGRRVGSPRTGLWSGLALAGSLLFGVSARAATPDATLIVCTTAAIATWAAAFAHGEPLGRWRWCAVYVLLGFAVLAKGPSGLVLPVAVMIVAETLSRIVVGPGARPAWAWVLIQLPGQAWKSLRVSRVFEGGLLSLAIAVPWYVAVGLATDWAWPAGFLGRHNMQRYLGPLEGHGGPVFYYLPAILIGLLPWSFWLPAATASLWRRLRTRTLDRTDLLLLSWIGVYVLVFSFAGTKLPSYVLPCYPALAVLVGRHLAASHERLSSGPFIALVILGVLLGTAFLAGGHWIEAQIAWLAMLGLIPVAGGLIGLRMNRRERPQAALGTFAVSAVVLFAALFGFAAEMADDRQTPVAFARQIQRLAGRPVPVATLDAFRPTLVYYTRGTVTDCPTPESAVEFLANSPDGFLVTREEHWEKLLPRLPPNTGLLAREGMFLRKFDLLLIGPVGGQPSGWPREEAQTAAAQPNAWTPAAR